VKRGTLIRVFVAGPSDVKSQREKVRKLIYEWNDNHSWKGVIAEPVMWETHSRAALGANPQKIIDRQLLDEFDCDVLFGIFHARLGSPTDTDASGTLEEIRYFSGKKDGNKDRVMLFFCQWDIKFDSDAAQRDAVEKFRTQAQQSGICPVVKKRDVFEKAVRNHLQKVLDELLGSVPVRNKRPSSKRAAVSKLKQSGTGGKRTAAQLLAAKFAGNWQMVKVPGSDAFTMVLDASLSAQRIYRSTVVEGTWKIKSGEAWVSWKDGWKDKLLLQSDGSALKVAFGRGADWDGVPNNRQPANKLD
jgi:hypothetical protein